MGCTCAAYVDEGDPRAALWSRIHGPGRSWPIRSPVRVQDASGRTFYEGLLPPGTEKFYTLVDFVARARHATAQEVAEDLRKRGIIPILSKGVTVSICPLHMRCLA